MPNDSVGGATHSAAGSAPTWRGEAFKLYNDGQMFAGLKSHSDAKVTMRVTAALVTPLFVTSD